MRLAFALFNYFPYGGLQRDFRRVLAACQALGADTVVYAMRWQGGEPEAGELHLFSGRGLTRVTRQRHFARFLEAEKRRGAFDLLCGFNRLPGLDYYFAADSCFAARARDRGPLYRLTPRARLYLDFEHAVFAPPSATRVLLLSPLQTEQYRGQYAVESERLALLPPGIATDRRAGGDAGELRAACRAEFGLRDEELLLLQIGSGFRVKGVDRALRALAAQPPALRARLRYLLVGQDDPAAFRRLAVRLGVADRVTVLPGRDDVPRLLQGADLLLHPAYSESAGLVLLEAVVAGLPVLTTASCGYAFHVERAGAGRVCREPFRQDRLNRLLEEMLSDTAGRARWRENGIDYGRREDLYRQPQAVAELLCHPNAWATRPLAPLPGPELAG